MIMQQVLAKLRKNWASELWVTLNEFKGQEKLDIREYFRPDDGPDYHPTRKGVSVPKHRVSELLDLIESIESEDSIGTIGTLELSENMQVRAGNREYLNRKYKELRIYIFSKKDDQWMPTRKGVTFKPDMALQLYLAIEEAMDFMRN